MTLSTLSPQILRLRKHPCAISLWSVEFDYRGSGSCGFCSTRAVAASAPDSLSGDVLLDCLDASLRRLPKPEWVWLNPFADAFVPQSDALATDTLLVLRTLMNLGIGVTLRTRGGLPLASPLVLLARRFPQLLRVEVAFLHPTVRFILFGSAERRQYLTALRYAMPFPGPVRMSLRALDRLSPWSTMVNRRSRAFSGRFRPMV